ncbi:MAG: SDR family NAD(P)-dependent oxidoreductase [Ferruginibacter sp.]
METTKKIILITGASDGIGLALANKFLNEGFHVIGSSRTGNITSIVHQDFFVIQLDVTSEASIGEAAKVIHEKYKFVDILINNAGVGTDLGTMAPQRTTFEQTINTNVTGLVFFAEAVLDLITNGGQVINVSSQLGSMTLRPHINSTAYRMSKAALNMYTKVLAERLKGQNIKVISLHPGWVATKLSTKGAPLTTISSANSVYNIIINNKPTATFWNAETGKELPW